MALIGCARGCGTPSLEYIVFKLWMWFVFHRGGIEVYFEGAQFDDLFALLLGFGKIFPRDTIN